MAPDVSALQKSLGQLRISVLVGLAACAALILSHTGLELENVERATTLTALGMALASTVARRLGSAAGMPPRIGIAFTIAGMLLALAVGGLGVLVSQSQGARETGLLFALGGFILALPRPQLPPLPGTAKG